MRRHTDVSKKMGRPRIEIDKGTFEGLCALQCTLHEISGFFKCSEDTVERWCKREYGETFADIYKIYSAGGKISLRRAQFKMAQKNVSMAIFLGKQYLGQKDRVEYDVTEALEKLDEVLGEIKGVDNAI